MIQGIVHMEHGQQYFIKTEVGKIELCSDSALALQTYVKAYPCLHLSWHLPSKRYPFSRYCQAKFQMCEIHKRNGFAIRLKWKLSLHEYPMYRDENPQAQFVNPAYRRTLSDGDVREWNRPHGRSRHVHRVPRYLEADTHHRAHERQDNRPIANIRVVG